MPRKGESIFKRKDGRWEGRYIKGRTEKEKAIYGYVYAKTYYDVKRKLRNAINCFEVQNEIPQSSKNDATIFLQASGEWLESIRPRIKASSYNKYNNLLNSYIVPVFGTEPLVSITSERIQELCNQLLQKGGAIESGLSTKTVSDTLSVLRSILRYAKIRGMEISCTGNEISLKQEKKELCILSRSEQKRLYDYLIQNPSNINLGILLSLFTGLRIGELCALTWNDISLDDHTVHVNKTMQRIQLLDESASKTTVVISTPKSQCSVRTIPLPENIISIINESFEGMYGYVLTGSDIQYIEPRTMQNHFKKITKKAKITPVNFHALRHTFATRCVEVGFDIKSLSEILGHANVAFTMSRYVHPTMQMKQENMQKLSALFMVR